MMLTKKSNTLVFDSSMPTAANRVAVKRAPAAARGPAHEGKVP